jgi:dTDP-4-dehydrorhamnose reductase
MRVLILGADGMLGHELVRNLRDGHEVDASVRRRPDGLVAPALDGSRVHVGFDARLPFGLLRLLEESQAEVVVNCVGLVKQRDEAKEALQSVAVNAMFPHQLLEAARLGHVRVIHLSTDCVFSGRLGGYREEDVPDPVDLYGRTKLLGELTSPPGLTLRTSIIGLELGRQTSLIEWFLLQRGVVNGFRKAIYSGLTTMEMARCIRLLIEDHPLLTGLWHLAAEPIDKFTLLHRLSRLLGRSDVDVRPDSSLVCDRSLRSERFTARTGYRPPDWDTMLLELSTRIRVRAGSA